MDTSSCIITSDEAKHTSGEVQEMNFWKKLFAGMGFVCGFLVFEACRCTGKAPAGHRTGCCQRAYYSSEPTPKTPQEVEAERQQMLARLRTELREQVCAIHVDVS